MHPTHLCVLWSRGWGKKTRIKSWLVSHLTQAAHIHKCGGFEFISGSHPQWHLKGWFLPTSWCLLFTRHELKLQHQLWLIIFGVVTQTWARNLSASVFFLYFYVYMQVSQITCAHQDWPFHVSLASRSTVKMITYTKLYIYIYTSPRLILSWYWFSSPCFCLHCGNVSRQQMVAVQGFSNTENLTYRKTRNGTRQQNNDKSGPFWGGVVKKDQKVGRLFLSAQRPAEE